ncbi:MAG: DUF177 domain-containing protein [Bryobacter sp.]
MLLTVRDLEFGPRPIALQFLPGNLELEEGLRQTSPLVVEGEARYSAALGEIQLRGRFTVNVEGDCDRCLDICRFPLDSTFALTYLPAEANVPPEETGLDEEAVEVAFYEGDSLDLREVFREQVLLALPMQRLCRENCRGLCPVCGANWNERECACTTADADNRWSALRAWKQ